MALAVHGVAMENYRLGTTLKEVGLKVDAFLKAKGLERFTQKQAAFQALGQLPFHALVVAAAPPRAPESAPGLHRARPIRPTFGRG